ncbi:GW dipeptide domain-containing protein [Virgibacillus halodenitrificans]|uniref:N-acetylglucosaminidase n=1 Tax=Virgibacillus halodenitrificans TaxID=1482 RepID=UPI001FB40E07|nr:GW dipeptide domain-containing protein [Virgibacillus halodenitrificans]MCJ0929618.1 GW dipeptide domain-containing protein [Virgibacillus halodenitrificans]WHX26073.1 GW dipeptide domain-containing protein [Virgibacillus halodenitrificans]
MKKSVFLIGLLLLNLLIPFTAYASEPVKGEEYLSNENDSELLTPDENQNQSTPANDLEETDEGEESTDSIISKDDKIEKENIQDNSKLDTKDNQTETETIDKENDNTIKTTDPTKTENNNGIADEDIQESSKKEKSVSTLSLSIMESNTSKLGHIRSADVDIYKNLNDLADSSFKAGTSYTNKVYYIKKQANLDDETYYLLSILPSSSSGVLGWVHSSDLSTHSHTGVDKNTKVFYIKGSGHSYGTAWGGAKDLIFDLSNYKEQIFYVHLTEKVGNNIWYRGELNNQTVWIHSSYLKETKESKTSLLGHIRSSKVSIYNRLEKDSSSFLAGDTYTNAVYYIKKQGEMGGEKYYLISTQPSYISGVVGWIKASDMSVHTHVGVDSDSKTFYFKGTGSGYSKAWGGVKNLVYQDLAKYKDEVFNVHLTEKVGNNTWYRGNFKGETIWIHSSYLVASQEEKTSKLGHIISDKVKIFDRYDLSSYTLAGQEYINEVYYIKKQTKINDKTYYLISKEPSSNRGVIGWVEASDMSVRTHAGVDSNSKTFYFKGTGSAYSKAWGGADNLVYRDMKTYEGQKFEVHLTEKVGNNIWYRGNFDGKTIWLHSSYLTQSTEIEISKLGHLHSEAKIYGTYGDRNTIIDSSKYLNAVYYIKKQAKVNGKVYYLISTQPSSSRGVIGWVPEEEISTHIHRTKDKKQKTLYFTGKGKAYSKAWGGLKDLIYKDLSQFQGGEFSVNLTETVGNNTWYRGVLNGRTSWVHEAFLEETNIIYKDYNMTFQEAVDIQMTRSPQTDKYRNQNAYIHAGYIEIIRSAVITGSGVRLRTAPQFGDNISVTVEKGTSVEILRTVSGDSYSGSNSWYEIKYKDNKLYVHSSLVDPDKEIAKTTAKVNVREGATTASHIFATLDKGETVNLVKKGKTWHEISFGTWRNAKRSDVEYYMNPNNSDPFQHLLLSSSVGVSAAELNKILLGKGSLEGLGQAFIDGGREHAVNEIYLISHALLETAKGTSKLATGITVNGKKVYNMFGIRAYDSCPERCGSEFAYEQGWDTPYKAIVGGAKFIGEDYIHNQYNQNTIYKMRWNLIYPPKQYATDIGWASKQIYQIKSLYELVENPLLQFEMPRFK